MKSLVLSVVLLTAVAGCGESPESLQAVEGELLPATDVAMSLVWWPVYWQTAPAPRVVWIYSNCSNGRGYLRDGQCLAGEFATVSNTILLAYRGNVSLTSTPFAHELCHAAIWVQSGYTTADPDHTNYCYYTGGQAITANAVLQANYL